MSEPMTDERRWDIHKQLNRFGMRCGYTDADVIRECLEEIDRLKDENDQLKQKCVGYYAYQDRVIELKEENRKLRESGAPATTFLEGEKP